MMLCMAMFVPTVLLNLVLQSANLPFNLHLDVYFFGLCIFVLYATHCVAYFILSFSPYLE